MAESKKRKTTREIRLENQKEIKSSWGNQSNDVGEIGQNRTGDDLKSSWGNQSNDVRKIGQNRTSADLRKDFDLGKKGLNKDEKADARKEAQDVADKNNVGAENPEEKPEKNLDAIKDDIKDNSDAALGAMATALAARAGVNNLQQKIMHLEAALRSKSQGYEPHPFKSIPSYSALHILVYKGYLRYLHDNEFDINGGASASPLGGGDLGWTNVPVSGAGFVSVRATHGDASSAVLFYSAAYPDVTDTTYDYIPLVEVAVSGSDIYIKEQLVHDNITLELGSTKATVVTSASANGGGSALTGNYSGDFSATPTVETNSGIIEGNTDGVLVKEGFSGIYLISMNILGWVQLGDLGTTTMVVECTVAGATSQPIWRLERTLDPSGHNTITNATYEDINGDAITLITVLEITVSETTKAEDSACAAVFVDASAEDIQISADWSLTATDGAGSAGITAFTVDLIELRDSAT